MPTIFILIQLVDCDRAHFKVREVLAEILIAHPKFTVLLGLALQHLLAFGVWDLLPYGRAKKQTRIRRMIRREWRMVGRRDSVHTPSVCEKKKKTDCERNTKGIRKQ